MRVSEVYKEKSHFSREYGLTITGSVEELASDGGAALVKQRILDWVGRRGRNASRVMLFVTSQRLPEQETQRLIQYRFEGDQDLASLRERLSFRIAFMDDQGEWRRKLMEKVQQQGALAALEEAERKAILGEIFGKQTWRPV